MAKQSGLGDHLLVSGYNVSGDIGSLSRIGGGPAALEVTGIDKGARERIGGLRDGSMEFNAYFNPGANRAHERFAALPTADQGVTYLRGLGLGAAGASMVAKVISYNGTRASDGGLTFAVAAQANGYGLEWGIQLTDGLQTDTAATDGDSVDHGDVTEFGLQAHLHVLAFTGTSATITIQESDDDAAWLDVAGGEFATVTGVSSQRIATARDLDVEPYLRVSTAGTFTNLVFAVLVARNETLVDF